MRITVISSVLPEPTSGGEIILHRHLLQEELEVEIGGTAPVKGSLSSLIRRAAGRMGRGIFEKHGEDFWAVWGGRWVDPALPRGGKASKDTVVLTVAHGDVFPAAVRYAKRNRLPLVSIFHDWWPDMPPAHDWARSVLERQFRDLYRASDVALCVSEGMREALGEHPGAEVLYPIPATCKPEFAEKEPVKGDVFKILYAGNIATYGDLLEQALAGLAESLRIRLEVRGAIPHDRQAEWKRWQVSGNWLPFAAREGEEFEDWVAGASAFLIPMVFDPALRRRMETSFPSKLTEFAQLGGPLVIWGPDYCSAVRWAKKTGAALCVTNPDPVVLRDELERLAASPEEQERFSAAARHAAQTVFHPANIQARFMAALERALVVPDSAGQRQSLSGME